MPVPRVKYQYALGLVVAAVVSIALGLGQEPPETTGADEDDADDDGDGACAGGCSPLLEFDALPELLDDELPLDDRTVEDPVEAL